MPQRLKYKYKISKYELNGIDCHAVQLKSFSVNQVKDYHCKKCLSPAYNQEYKHKNFTECMECGSEDFQNMNYVFRENGTVIDKIGVEMEGRWESYPPDYDKPKILYFHEDGSVNVNGRTYRRNMDDGENYRTEECLCCIGECDHCNDPEDEDDQCYCDCQRVRIEPDDPDFVKTRGNVHTGEYITTPQVYDRMLRNLTPIILRNYPHNTNTSCGGHFHISFKNTKCYGIAMNKKLWSLIKRKLGAYVNKNCTSEEAQITHSRIHGVSYCYNKYLAEDQMMGDGDRYCHLNFAYQKHGTMEVRILPMYKNVSTYLKTLRLTVRLIDEFVKEQISKQTAPVKEKARVDVKGVIRGKTGYKKIKYVNKNERYYKKEKGKMQRIFTSILEI